MRFAVLAAAAALVAAPASAVVTSPPLIDTAKGSLYLFISPQDWYSAQAEAELYGGDLVTIGSEYENDLLYSVFSGLSPKLGYWTGYNDIYDDDFTWVSGEPNYFENWYPGEPNGPGGQAVHVYNYGDRGGYWNDRDPYSILPAIVEIDLGYSVPGGPIVLPNGGVIPEPAAATAAALALAGTLGFRRRR